MIQRFSEQLAKNEERYTLADLAQRMEEIEVKVAQLYDSQEIGVTKFNKETNRNIPTPYHLEEWRVETNTKLPRNVHINDDDKVIATNTEKEIGEVKIIESKPTIVVSVEKAKKERCLTYLSQEIKYNRYPILFV